MTPARLVERAHGRTLPGERPPRPASGYAQLSRQVQDAGLMRRRLGFYWGLLLTLVGAFAGLWVAFALVGDSWFQLVVAALLAVVVAQFGFFAHDAAHRQVFASPRWNEWTARLVAGGFVGLSHAWWLHKHNRHHAAPNQEGKDPDIGAGVLAFTPAAVGARTGFGAWFARRQGWAFFPLLLLEGLSLHVDSLRELFGRRDLRHRRLEISLVVGRLAAVVTVVAVVLPPGKAAAFLGLQVALFGALLGGAFAPNHKGMPLVPRDARLDFLSRQVLMSRNITGGPVTDVAMGGLNYQIEHHLFPSMPRPNLRRAQPMVRAFCRQQGIAYTQMSLVGSYAVVVRYLNRVGLGERDPFACPLVQALRD
jgi:fatty acid desaturase